MYCNTVPDASTARREQSPGRGPTVGAAPNRRHRESGLDMKCQLHILLSISILIFGNAIVIVYRLMHYDEVARNMLKFDHAATSVPQ